MGYCRQGLGPGRLLPDRRSRWQARRNGVCPKGNDNGLLACFAFILPALCRVDAGVRIRRRRQRVCNEDGYIRKAVAADLTAKTNLGDIKLRQTDEERDIARKTDSLVALLSNAEKAAQMVILLNGQWSYAQIASSGLGAVFSGPPTGNAPTDWAAMIDSIQDRVAATGPHKIPVFFGHDCVHGNGSVAGSTVFPEQRAWLRRRQRACGQHRPRGRNASDAAYGSTSRPALLRCAMKSGGGPMRASVKRRK